MKIVLLSADGSRGVEKLRADKGEYTWEKGVFKAGDDYRFRVDLDGFNVQANQEGTYDVSANFLTFIDCI